MPVNAAQVPPQALQALQQSGAQGGDITEILAQLAQMSPEEVSQALAQLGVQIDPETLQQAAEQWVDRAAEDASGNKAAPTTPDDESSEPTPDSEPAEGETETPTQDDEAAEPTPDDEAAEGEAPQQAGGSAMPRGPSDASGGMDDLISAAMMQGAAGNANAPVPVAPQARRAGMPAMPAGRLPSRPSGPATDPRMAAMIANVYRQQAAPRGAAPPRSRTRG